MFLDFWKLFILKFGDFWMKLSVYTDDWLDGTESINDILMF